jgi:hypothetical protein
MWKKRVCDLENFWGLWEKVTGKSEREKVDVKKAGRRVVLSGCLRLETAVPTHEVRIWKNVSWYLFLGLNILVATIPHKVTKLKRGMVQTKKYERLCYFSAQNSTWVRDSHVSSPLPYLVFRYRARGRWTNIEQLKQIENNYSRLLLIVEGKAPPFSGPPDLVLRYRVRRG